MNSLLNRWVQATPDYAFLLILGQRPGAPDPRRWAAVGHMTL